jgi:pimeloyl-ACP methyl ester carboxylesterase
MSSGVLALDGASLRYEVSGEGPAVVLVHGFALDLRMWDAQLDELAARFRVVRYDCRGFGGSGAFDPAVPYTHAGDLVALLDHLRIGVAVLAGLSFGGQVALQAALLAPERVRGLVLLDSVLDGVPWDPESRAGLKTVDSEVRDGGVAAGRRAWLAHPLFATAREHPDLTAQLTGMVDRYPGQHWLGLDPHQASERPVTDALAELAVPTLVVAGERDVPGFLDMAEVLATRIPGARATRVPGAGHMVSMEQPAIVNDLLIGFISGLPDGEPGRGLEPAQGLEEAIAEGRRHRAAGELDAALAVFTDAHERFPAPARPLVERGAILILQLRYEASRADYDAARRLEPGYPGLDSYVAELDLYTGRPAEALALSEQAAAREPGDLMHQINIAHAHLLLGHTGQALQAYRQLAHRVHPSKKRTGSDLALQDLRLLGGAGIEMPGLAAARELLEGLQVLDEQEHVPLRPPRLS